MFVVTEAEAAAIRAAFEQEGEFSAAIELRRLFPGITDNATARLHAWIIAGWEPRPAPVRPATRRHSRKEGYAPRQLRGLVRTGALAAGMAWGGREN
jgi:hypothetical protein